MARRSYSRDDVQTHSDHFGSGLPAVNVKVYRDMRDAWKDFERAERPDAGFTLEWIEENYSETYLDELFWMTCGWELEHFEGWATGSDNVGDPMFPGYNVTLEQQGRSGGWLVIRGLPELEDWDAVLLARWRRFERIARETADGIPYQMLCSLEVNEWEGTKDETAERERAARQDIATIERTS